MNIRDTFGARITELRNALGLTQGELAEKIGISRQSVTLYENKTRIPDIEVLGRFATFFNVTSDYLIGITDAKTTDTDLKAVCEYMGLSQTAAEKLHHTSLSNKGTGFVSTLSNIIEDEEFVTFLALISESQRANAQKEEFIFTQSTLLKYSAEDIIKYSIDYYLKNILARIRQKFLAIYDTQEKRDALRVQQMLYNHAKSMYDEGALTDEEYKLTISEYDKGNFDFSPISLKENTNAQENQRQE